MSKRRGIFVMEADNAVSDLIAERDAAGCKCARLETAHLKVHEYLKEIGDSVCKLCEKLGDL